MTVDCLLSGCTFTGFMYTAKPGHQGNGAYTSAYHVLGDMAVLTQDNAAETLVDKKHCVYMTYLCKVVVLILMKLMWWLVWGSRLNSFGAWGVPCAAWNSVNIRCSQLRYL